MGTLLQVLLAGFVGAKGKGLWHSQLNSTQLTHPIQSNPIRASPTVGWLARFVPAGVGKGNSKGKATVTGGCQEEVLYSYDKGKQGSKEASTGK